MIDFRYHLVSLAAVLIALSVGIVLGAGLALWLSLRDVALDGRPVRHAADRGAERGEHDG